MTLQSLEDMNQHVKEFADALRVREFNTDPTSPVGRLGQEVESARKREDELTRQAPALGWSAAQAADRTLVEIAPVLQRAVREMAEQYQQQLPRDLHGHLERLWSESNQMHQDGAAAYERDRATRAAAAPAPAERAPQVPQIATAPPAPSIPDEWTAVQTMWQTIAAAMPEPDRSDPTWANRAGLQMAVNQRDEKMLRHHLAKLEAVLVAQNRQVPRELAALRDALPPRGMRELAALLDRVHGHSQERSTGRYTAEDRKMARSSGGWSMTGP